MPGRKYTAGSGYRYGFNGQEKEKDLNENITTALFWEYDSRIGRRWNIDPKPNLRVSPYSCFDGNPISFTDAKGDTLSYNLTNQETSDDLRSIVAKQNQDYLVLGEKGEVGLSEGFQKLTLNEKQQILEKDPGLKVLSDMVNNTNNFFYSVSDRIRYLKTDVAGKTLSIEDNRLTDFYNAGDKLSESDGKGGVPLYNTFTNLANTVRGDEATVGYGQKPAKEYKIGDHTRKFDGEVYFAPGEFYAEREVGKSTINVPRSSVVFHELRENFLRVVGMGSGPMSYPAAHKQASEDSYMFGSSTFGVGFISGEKMKYFILGTTSPRK